MLLWVNGDCDGVIVNGTVDRLGNYSDNDTVGGNGGWIIEDRMTC